MQYITMDNLQDVIKKISYEQDVALFKLVHEKVVSLAQKIKFDIFPLYIRYMIKDKVVAILYFYKKNFLDLGLRISKNKIAPNFFDAAYMKYPGITYGLKIEKKADIKNINIDN